VIDLALRMSHRRLTFVPLVLALGACSADRSMVALSAKVENPSLEVQSSAVGADASGGFELVMALGEYASESTQVSLGSFSLMKDGVEVLSPLSLSGAKFPVSLGIGKELSVSLSFEASAEPAVADELCQGELEIKGTLMDSLSNDHPTRVGSQPFAASCD
jgi:hypothetical protein